MRVHLRGRSKKKGNQAYGQSSRNRIITKGREEGLEDDDK